MNGGYDSYDDFQVWKLSGYVVLPYPGSFRQQPEWLRQDFRTLLKLQRWHEINKGLPNAQGFKRIEDTV